MTNCPKCGGRRMKRCGTCKDLLCARCYFYKRDSMTNKPKSDCISCYNWKRRAAYARRLVGLR